MLRKFRDNWETERFLAGLKAFTVISFLILAVANIAVYRDFIGTPVRLVTEKFATFLTPDHWVFHLMSLVVFLQLIFTIYQALPDDAEKTPYLTRLNFFLPTSWLFEGAAVISMAFEIIWLSLFFNTIALVFLAIAYFRLNALPLQLAHVMAARIDGRDKACASFYYLIFYAPTSMNLALLSVGWVLNLFMTFSSFGYKIPFALPIIGAVFAAILGFVMLGVKKDVVFALTIGWCLLGVGTRWIDLKAVAVTNLLSTALLVLVSLIVFGISIRKTPNILEKEGVDSYRIKSSYQTGIHTESSRLVSS
jgi:hypothetical protein